MHDRPKYEPCTRDGKIVGWTLLDIQKAASEMAAMTEKHLAELADHLHGFPVSVDPNARCDLRLVVSPRLWEKFQSLADCAIELRPKFCAVCHREGVNLSPLVYVSPDGWRRETPVCKHGAFYLCKECDRPENAKCPLCGCAELQC